MGAKSVKISIFPLIIILLLSSSNALNARNNKKKHFSIAKRTIVKNHHKYSQVYDHSLGRKRLVEDSVIVKFKKNADQEAINNYLEENNLELGNKLGKNTYVCKAKSSKYKFLKYLRSENLEEQKEVVELMDINEIKTVQASALRNKSAKTWRTKHAKKQWHLRNDGRNGIIAGSDVSIDGAWEHTMGAGVRVAVIDTGFDLNHPDIPYYNQGFNALSFDPASNSNSSRTPQASNAGAPDYSEENHGTAVAGIIAAKDNNKGVVGIAPESEIIPIRMIDDTGSVSIEQIIMAFKEAERLGAKIINNSWGSYDPSLSVGEQLEISDMEKDMYKEIAETGNDGKGVLIIFSSGNSGKPNFDNAPEARLKETLAVGATDSTDQLTRYSVYGDELDIVAPGGGFRPIFTTDRRDFIVKETRNGKRVKKKMFRGYSRGGIANGFRGTSASAPVVSGIAALVWSINPELSAKEVREILINSADKVRKNGKYKYINGKSQHMGNGRVNAKAAVELALETI